MLFNIQIPTPTADEAYRLFLNNINRVDWYEENGRPYFLKSLYQMENPLINQMVDERQILKQDEELYIEKFRRPFEERLYHPEHYKRISDEILSYNDKYMSNNSKSGSKGMASTGRKIPADILFLQDAWLRVEP